MKTAEEFWQEKYGGKPSNECLRAYEEEIELMESYAKERVKDELTLFLDFLLKNGYCDVDVYSEPPTAIDRYMYPNLNQ